MTTEPTPCWLCGLRPDALIHQHGPGSANTHPYGQVVR